VARESSCDQRPGRGTHQKQKKTIRRIGLNLSNSLLDEFSRGTIAGAAESTRLAVSAATLTSLEDKPGSSFLFFALDNRQPLKSFQPQTNPKYQFADPIHNSLRLFEAPNHAI
jgi:hypothetical protein